MKTVEEQNDGQGDTVKQEQYSLCRSWIYNLNIHRNRVELNGRKWGELYNIGYSVSNKRHNKAEVLADKRGLFDTE